MYNPFDQINNSLGNLMQMKMQQRQMDQQAKQFELQERMQLQALAQQKAEQDALIGYYGTGDRATPEAQLADAYQFKMQESADAAQKERTRKELSDTIGLVGELHKAGVTPQTLTAFMKEKLAGKMPGLQDISFNGEVVETVKEYKDGELPDPMSPGKSYPAGTYKVKARLTGNPQQPIQPIGVEPYSAPVNQMEMLLARDELSGQRQERQFEQQSKLQAEREAAAERRLAAQLAASDRRTAQQIAASQKKTASKPMPAAALKMQQEELDAIGTAEGIKSDLGAVLQQLTSGKLDLGPVSNLVAKGRNVAGMSNESSRNFASFRSTLEKLRNDSLRLNKGVQTEGDAQRAWNELFEGINDPALVKQRLDEIQRINDRAATHRQMNIENIRNNYGQDALDTGGYKAPAPVLGPKRQQQSPAQKPQRPLSGPAQAVINKYRPRGN